MVSDGALLVVALVGLSATISLVLFFAGFFTKPAKTAEVPDEAVAVGGGRRAAAGGLAALRRRKEKKKRGGDGERAAGQEAQAEAAAAAAAAAAAPVEAAANNGDEQEDNADIEPRAMTKKELQKELKRREREEMRRFDEAQREEQRRRTSAKEEIEQKKREEEARKEEAREEQARKLAEEKALKEQEEFDKWKDMFSIEEEGSKLAEDSEESQALLQEFVDYIKLHKVVLLEDLAVEFNLATRDAIQRVEALQESNRLTGIVDDRGKFIYITDEEMDKVARFIQRRGRLGLAELAKECNKLIRLDAPEDESKSAASALDWLNSDEPAVQADLTL